MSDPLFAAFLFDFAFFGQRFRLHHVLAMLTHPVAIQQRRPHHSAEKTIAGFFERRLLLSFFSLFCSAFSNFTIVASLVPQTIIV